MTCFHCGRQIYNFQDFVTSEKPDGTVIYRHDSNYGLFNCWKYRKVKIAVEKTIESASVLIRRSAVVPADLRCIVIEGGTTNGDYYLDEFPRDIFPANSFLLHDASHYGLRFTPDEVY